MTMFEMLWLYVLGPILFAVCLMFAVAGVLLFGPGVIEWWERRK